MMEDFALAAMVVLFLFAIWYIDRKENGRYKKMFGEDDDEM